MVLHTCSQVETTELIKAIVFPSAVAKAVLFQEGTVEYWSEELHCQQMWSSQAWGLMASLIEEQASSYKKSFCPKIVVLVSTMETERNIFVLLQYIFLMCNYKVYPSGVVSVQQEKLNGSCSWKN